MTRGSERSVTERAVSSAFALFFTTLLIYVAVKLLLAIWVELLVIACIGTLVAVLVTVYRSRGRGW